MDRNYSSEFDIYNNKSSMAINMTLKLLTRDEFRNGVFDRDNYRCCVPWCKEKAVDAHHIIERKLWENGGYYLNNGASLCETHHKLAERNKLLPLQLRSYCNIMKEVLPPKLALQHLKGPVEFNKWGEPLKEPRSVKFKYPCTVYLPFSDIPKNHGRDIGDVKHITGIHSVILLKMDGSCSMLDTKIVAARNGLEATHRSFDMLKRWHSMIKHKIPNNYKLFGEWLYAKHSIHYKDKIKLKGFFQLFAVFDVKRSMWCHWDNVKSIAEMVGCRTVPVLGYLDDTLKPYQIEQQIKKIANEQIKKGHEGVVVRNHMEFHYSQFSENVMKYVRPNHVQTSRHWQSEKIVRNEVDV